MEGLNTVQKVEYKNTGEIYKSNRNLFAPAQGQGSAKQSAVERFSLSDDSDEEIDSPSELDPAQNGFPKLLGTGDHPMVHQSQGSDSVASVESNEFDQMRVKIACLRSDSQELIAKAHAYR